MYRYIIYITLQNYYIVLHSYMPYSDPRSQPPATSQRLLQNDSSNLDTTDEGLPAHPIGVPQMVPGYKSDYEVQSSPLPPPYSPLSPVVKYVLFAVCALFLNEHLHYHLYDHREPPSNLKEAVQFIVEDLAPKCSDDILQLRIRRGDLVQDAIHEGKKGKFIPGKQLQVSN